MVYESIQMCLGLAGLIFGANILVEGSIGLAYNYKWPTLWVGTIVVGFATTLPEMIVSLIAVINNYTHIAIGNALGSYVANIGMVLGITAIVYPMTISRKVLLRELPLLTASVILLAILISDYNLSQLDGYILLSALAVFIWLISKNKSVVTSAINLERCKINLTKSYLLFIIGTIILWVSGDILVNSAGKIAKLLGMSDWAIGLTIVAVGTSLPELATSIVSAKQGHYDLAIGNVVGSNVLGLLGVIAIPSIMAPGHVPKIVISQDILAMTVMTITLWLTMLKKPGKKSIISRLEGFVLFILFMVYLIINLK